MLENKISKFFRGLSFNIRYYTTLDKRVLFMPYLLKAIGYYIFNDFILNRFRKEEYIFESTERFKTRKLEFLGRTWKR